MKTLALQARLGGFDPHSGHINIYKCLMDINDTLGLLNLSFQIAKTQADANFKLDTLNKSDDLSLVDDTIEIFRKLKCTLES